MSKKHKKQRKHNLNKSNIHKDYANIKKPEVIKKIEEEKKARKRKTKKKFNWKKFFAWFSYITVISFLILSIIFLLYVAHISKDLPTTDGLIHRVVPETTQIYDRTGTVLLYELHGEENRTVIDIEDLPPYVYNAVVAIEDKDFYNHKGFVPKRILKAAYVDAINIIWKIFTGHPKTFYQGASTITQQFIKNSILTNEFSINRKLKELILAWQLEKRFSKKQILKMYLNEIPFGSVYYGLESASKHYFGKHAKDLSIAEAATLAAMIQRPSYFSPYGSHVDELIERQKMVIHLMETQGYISHEEAEEALKEKLTFKSDQGNIKAPHFVMYTISYLEELLGEEYSEQLLKEGGLKIYTSLDYHLQEIAENVIDENIDNIEKHNGDNVGLVAIDPKTGQILAMVGSRDYFDKEHDGQYNVTLALRQPGSSMKPLVYLAAFMKGYYPETILYDVVTNFSTSGRPYIPYNYDFKEHGPVSMKKALQGSLNIPAVKTLYLAGLDNVLNLAKKLGYTTLNDKDRFGLSFVLGGAEVKLLEHTNAFATFANDGKYNKVTPIIKIVDRYGKVIKESKAENKQVIPQNAVRMLNNTLSDNQARAYVFGLNSPLQLGKRPVAAKTGTTNDYKDAWTMGYTPSLAAGVWVGRNNNKAMVKGSGGITLAAPIWNEFMKRALQDKPIEYFPAAPFNNSTKPVLNGSIVNGIKVKIDKVSGKLATENTPEEFIEEKTFREVHCILYYCDKDNPNGPIPTNPAKDPQFNNWENAVQKWLAKYNEEAEKDPNDDKIPIDTSKPPTEYDDVHTEENKPELTILTPEENATISASKLVIAVEAKSKRGIAKYEYWLDNKIIPNNNTNYVEYPLNNVSIGEHTIKVRVSDDVGNFREKEIKINIAENNFVADIQVLYPRNNSSYPSSAFPLTFTLNIIGANKINRLYLCYQKLDSNNDSYKCITINDLLLEGQNTVKWKDSPELGSYKYYFKALTNVHKTITSDKRLIKIR